MKLESLCWRNELFNFRTEEADKFSAKPAHTARTSKSNYSSNKGKRNYLPFFFILYDSVVLGWFVKLFRTFFTLQTRDINVAFKAAKRQNKIKMELERKLAKKGFVLRRKSPGGRHRTLLTSSTRARQLGRTANKVIDTSRNLVQRYVDITQIIL